MPFPEELAPVVENRAIGNRFLKAICDTRPTASMPQNMET
jgi:hypothetical protein